MSRFDARELGEALLRAGVSAGAVLDVEAVLQAPHAAHRGMVDRRGDYQGVGVPIKMEQSPGGSVLTPKSLGTHSREVFQTAGMSRAEIDQLVKARVLIDKTAK